MEFFLCLDQAWTVLRYEFKLHWRISNSFLLWAKGISQARELRRNRQTVWPIIELLVECWWLSVTDSDIDWSRHVCPPPSGHPTHWALSLSRHNPAWHWTWLQSTGPHSGSDSPPPPPAAAAQAQVRCLQSRCHRRRLEKSATLYWPWLCVSDLVHVCKNAKLLVAQNGWKTCSKAVHLNPLNEAMKMSEEVVCRCSPGTWTLRQSDRWQNQNWNLGTRTPRTNIPSKSVAAWCWTGGQTQNIADSRFVFITLIMSNKRGEQYFIDNFRAGLEPTQGKNYKTSPKWPGARSDQPGSNCYDHEIVSREIERNIFK